MTDFDRWWWKVVKEEHPSLNALSGTAVTLRVWAQMGWELSQPQWQPIETAPKGTYSESKDDPEWVDPPRVLLSTPEGVVIAQWDYYYDGSVGGHGYCGNDSAWVTDEGELVCDTPMYWMPLPQPPK